MAAGTPAGTDISNTATATYDDNNPATPEINATSNTVNIQVAEVAGVIAVAQTPEDVNGNAVEAGDTLRLF
ncbi:MAG: hypothetical protein HC790_12745 [Acaryochloridaceae cyanobacterium CSU_3_4]|nr:hypothetical protein [Acaryochloridaceae cyanobacterium CSU_3_4]